MIIVTIKQGYSEVVFETELYPDAELLISTVLGLWQIQASKQDKPEHR